MKAPAFWLSPSLHPFAVLLTPFSWLYRIGTTIRNLLTKTYKAPVPVICIGNITMGGAGKTPVALSLGERMEAAGYKPHFLTRGYGGNLRGPIQVDLDKHTAADVGDEPMLLAQQAPTWVSKDRAAGAKAAAEAGASHIIMDDGFQNPSLHKDVSLMVVDSGVGLGNGCVFPAGPLRETPARAAERADMVIMMHQGNSPKPERQSGTGMLPILHARTVASRPELLPEGTLCIAFAGIGRPDKFFDTLEELGLAVLHKASYADHYVYTDRDIESLRSAAVQAGAVLVTTEKDWVRIPNGKRIGLMPVPIALSWDDNIDPVQKVFEVLRDGGKKHG